MNPPAAVPSPGGAARRGALEAALLELFQGAGYAPIDVPILQPAELYLERAGEDIRSRMYFLDAPGGGELCLRADLTLPIVAALAKAAPAWPRRVAAAGPTFRVPRAGGAGAEMHQAGIESFGVADRAGAECEVFKLALEGVRRAYGGPLRITVGDVSLFAALIDGFAIDPRRARRLMHAFRHPALLAKVLGEAAPRPSLPAGLPREETREAFVSFARETLNQKGIDLIGGRTIEEIADHLLEKTADAKAAPIGHAAARAVDAFLKIEGEAKSAILQIEGLAVGGPVAGLAKALMGRISALMPALGPSDEIRVSTTLGRRFLYYTGFVFEIAAPSGEAPLAAGGRYDTLLADMGAGGVPAIGAALFLDRLLDLSGAP